MSTAFLELVRRYYLQWMAIAAALAGLGCGTDGPSDPQPTESGPSGVESPRFEMDGKEIRYRTDRGNPVVVRPDGRGVSFEITSPSGDRFGFRFETDRFAEWSIRGGIREELSLESWDDLGGEVYRFNGEAVALRRSDVEEAGSFPAAFTELSVGKLPLEASTLYHNPLGEELAQSINTRFVEIAQSQKWVNDDGSCSDNLSTAATICSRFKCTLGGGAANPLCHVCIGVTAVCGIMALVSLFGGN